MSTVSWSIPISRATRSLIVSVISSSLTCKESAVFFPRPADMESGLSFESDDDGAVEAPGVSLGVTGDRKAPVPALCLLERSTGCDLDALAVEPTHRAVHQL